jgi:hypothetical protein
VTVWAVETGTSTAARGAVKLSWVADTRIGTVAVVPSALTVSVSAPAATPVTWKRACPAPSVTTVEADRVLPTADATVTDLPAMTPADESRRLTV